MIDELEQLKALLWEKWDPIGVNGSDCPRDEYDSYATRIFTMLSSGADRGAIIDYLDWAVGDNMGLTSNSQESAKIADQVILIHAKAKQ